MLRKVAVIALVLSSNEFKKPVQRSVLKTNNVPRGLRALPVLSIGYMFFPRLAPAACFFRALGTSCMFFPRLAPVAYLCIEVLIGSWFWLARWDSLRLAFVCKCASLSKQRYACRSDIQTKTGALDKWSGTFFWAKDVWKLPNKTNSHITLYSFEPRML